MRGLIWLLVIGVLVVAGCQSNELRDCQLQNEEYQKQLDSMNSTMQQLMQKLVEANAEPLASGVQKASN